jgi:dephospho-CoA kinase
VGYRLPVFRSHDSAPHITIPVPPTYGLCEPWDASDERDRRRSPYTQEYPPRESTPQVETTGSFVRHLPRAIVSDGISSRAQTRRVFASGCVGLSIDPLNRIAAVPSQPNWSSMSARRRWPIHHPRTRPAGPWKHGPIPVIGLVGGIGSGKSAVAARLGELGAFVIDADKVGHALLTQRPIQELLVERFGPEILLPAISADEGESSSEQPAPREIDRRALGSIVFADKSARKVLEEILHPRMRETFAKAIKRTVRRAQASAVVLDAAVLYEAGWDGLCDRVLYIDAPRELRLDRLAAQRGWDADAVLSRENAQHPLEEKRALADLIVANTNGLDALHEWIDRAWAPLTTAPPSAKPDRRPPPHVEMPTKPPRGSHAR